MDGQGLKTPRIYLDYAATTPADKEVLKAMMPYFYNKFGNASSVHSFGQEAIAAIDQARQKVADFFECGWREIIFTGSATEANNLAILGIAKNFKFQNPNTRHHFITTNIEHESAHEPLGELEKLGHEITYVKCNKEGLINVLDIEKAIKSNTLLISVIHANNEIGTIQPIKEIGRFVEKLNELRKKENLSRIYFHTDAAQALNYLEVRPDWLKVDLMTFSGHKIYGPKGVGGLYVRNHESRIKNQGSNQTISHNSKFIIHPIITGGGQEFGLRSGTENVPYIVGLAKAVGLVAENKTNLNKISALKNKLFRAILKINKSAKLNGSEEFRLPNNLNLRFPGFDNETLLIAFDQAGLAVSAGSACSARSLSASHVLTAIGLSEKEARESIRITLGRYTTEDEIKRIVEIIRSALES